MPNDATRRLVQLRLVASESIAGYFEVSRKYFESHGLPVSFYVDRHSVFCVNQRQKKGLATTQFGRPMGQLVGTKVTIIESRSGEITVESGGRLLACLAQVQKSPGPYY